jgi:hypothetical protein
LYLPRYNLIFKNIFEFIPSKETKYFYTFTDYNGNDVSLNEEKCNNNTIKGCIAGDNNRRIDVNFLGKNVLFYDTKSIKYNILDNVFFSTLIGSS